MLCPVCNVELLLADRQGQGIEIDDCPKCRGIWLDRGELDKLIERSAIGRRKGMITGKPLFIQQPGLTPICSVSEE